MAWSDAARAAALAARRMHMRGKSASELMSFWAQHQHGRGYRVVLGSGVGRRSLTANLANYAANKATMLSTKARGDRKTAAMYGRLARKSMRGL